MVEKRVMSQKFQNFVQKKSIKLACQFSDMQVLYFSRQNSETFDV